MATLIILDRLKKGARASVARKPVLCIYRDKVKMNTTVVAFSVTYDCMADHHTIFSNIYL